MESWKLIQKETISHANTRQQTTKHPQETNMYTGV